MNRKKTEHIVQTLKERIARGVLREGDRVPSEAELAKEFKVARMTAREALRRLEWEGLIRTESTLGRFVTKRARESLTLAASGDRRSSAQESLIQTSSIGTIEIDGKPCELLIDEDDNIFIPMDPVPERNGLMLDDTVYKLRLVARGKEDRICQVLGLRPGKIINLLKRSEEIPKAHLVWLVES